MDSQQNPQLAQQYNLKWTNHTYNMLQTFSEQFSKENFVDCTLTCEGQLLKVHKMILSGCSHYFQQLFEVYKDPNPLIIMNGVKFINLKKIIEFMYHGEVKIMEEELESLLLLAETFKVKGLSNVRNRKLNKTDEDSHSTKKRKLSADNDVDLDDDRKEIEQTNIVDEPKTDETPPIKNNPQETQIQKMQNIEQKIDKRPRILKRVEPTKPAVPSTSTTITTVGVDDNEYVKAIELPKIPRPPNAFMIFANEWRRKIAEEHPGENNKEISVHLGNMWKQLGKIEKEKYYRAAQKADKDHKTKYPGYYYSPKEARIRKEMKTNQNKNKKPLFAGHFLLLSSDDEPHPTDVLDISN